MNTSFYYAMTQPGIETIAWKEIHTTQPNAEFIKFYRGIVLFRSNASPRTLLQMRTIEDLYIGLVHARHLGNEQGVLKVLHGTTKDVDISVAIKKWQLAHNGERPHSWRIVCQKVGNHTFRRIDAQDAVTQALKKIIPGSYKHIEESADLEFWIWVGPHEALIGLRCSDASMRHRTYKSEHIPASLRPTVAATMSFLSQPTVEDIVVDPLCGAGTLLIERGLMSPFKKLSGGDKETSAIHAAKKNAYRAHVDMQLSIWDAQTLPLSNESVNRILTNLPFGKRIGTQAINRSLYPALLAEFGRILSKDGMMVTCTSDNDFWNDLLHQAHWKINKKLVFSLLGQPATIFVTTKG